MSSLLNEIALVLSVFTAATTATFEWGLIFPEYASLSYTYCPNPGTVNPPVKLTINGGAAMDFTAGIAQAFYAEGAKTGDGLDYRKCASTFPATTVVDGKTIFKGGSTTLRSEVSSLTKADYVSDDGPVQVFWAISDEPTLSSIVVLGAVDAFGNVVVCSHYWRAKTQEALDKSTTSDGLTC